METPTTPQGRVHDRQGMKNAAEDFGRAVQCLSAGADSLNLDRDGRAAFHLAMGAVEAGRAGLAAVEAILQSAVASETLSKGTKIEQMASPEFLAHLRIAVELATDNGILQHQIDENPDLEAIAEKQYRAVAYLSQYLSEQEK